MNRPTAGEFDPYYATYIDQVPDRPILETLEREGEAAYTFLSRIGEERAGHRYAPGKWSVREVVGHVIDIERVFAYRALSFARRDPAPLPGVEQEVWTPAGQFDERRLAGLAAELRAVRAATVALFGGLPAGAGAAIGSASGGRVSVRALAWMIAGHELHHRRILEERYLGEGLQ